MDEDDVGPMDETLKEKMARKDARVCLGVSYTRAKLIIRPSGIANQPNGLGISAKPISHGWRSGSLSSKRRIGAYGAVRAGR
jgi:hypothetical protein